MAIVIISAMVLLVGIYSGAQRAQRITKNTTLWPLCFLGVLRDPLLIRFYRRYQNLFCFAFIILCLAACTQKKSAKIQRPRDPWAFRSVLDSKPRMLTLALDSACYAAYDLAHCTLYKAWKGGVMLEGAAYTNKKNVQPTTWGMPYYDDNVQHSK